MLLLSYLPIIARADVDITLHQNQGQNDKYYHMEGNELNAEAPKYPIEYDTHYLICFLLFVFLPSFFRLSSVIQVFLGAVSSVQSTLTIRVLLRHSDSEGLRQFVYEHDVAEHPD